MGTLITALRATVLTLVLTAGIYPLVTTLAAQLLFSHRANGSLVSVAEGGPSVGSELIAQGFSRPEYFQPRPSAAGDKGWDPQASGGSNYGPGSQKLRDRVVGDADRLGKENPNAGGPIPAELLTASGSGLDPEISPDAARWQVTRVAAARHVAPQRVQEVVETFVEDRTLGFVGEPRVNVLLLNMQIDKQFGQLPAPPPAPAAPTGPGAVPAPPTPAPTPS